MLTPTSARSRGTSAPRPTAVPRRPRQSLMCRCRTRHRLAIGRIEELIHLPQVLVEKVLQIGLDIVGPRVEQEVASVTSDGHAALAFAAYRCGLWRIRTGRSLIASTDRPQVAGHHHQC